MTTPSDAFGARARLAGSALTVDYYRLGALAKESGVVLDRLPVTVKILLENVLRHQDKPFASADDVLSLARWNPATAASTAASELPFMPSRVVLQDFTGVPAVVDFAAMRAAVARAGGDPERINPLVPADLVIDHSVQVDVFGSPDAFAANVKYEHARNRERYLLLRWAQKAFKNFRVVPPGTGIVHQVNLEYLASVVDVRAGDGGTFAFPDTLVGTDSHTTMVNGLGVLGWGVGGIEAEAVLLGQPLYQLQPVVTGCKLIGELPPGTTATDLVLTLTQMLRKHGVVGKFVEFFGPGCAVLGIADRATLSNMSPEYGATAGLFPVDDETLRYLRATGREAARVDLVERYCKEQGLFRTPSTPEPVFSEIVTLDLATVEPSLAGPRRPQDRASLSGVASSFRTTFEKRLAAGAGKSASITRGDRTDTLTHGGVVIAAITSCTNTSNPSVMLAAGLLAEKAVARGLVPKSYVKTSLAPGSRVVTEYLRDAGVLPALEALGFNLVGYGCTTCIAAGTPVLTATGTSRRIQDLGVGNARLFGPGVDGTLTLASQTAFLDRGIRECVMLTFEDGRTLVCTPDHELRCGDGRWVRADRLRIGADRVVMGLEAPVDDPGLDEIEYGLRVGGLQFGLGGPAERARTLAFARLLGYLHGGGVGSDADRDRIRVGQAVDREQVLDDLGLVTGERPLDARYEGGGWTIALPAALTAALAGLDGPQAGRRVGGCPTLPGFVVDERCPVAIVREFAAGAFGAYGEGPVLGADLEAPTYTLSAAPEYVAALERTLQQMLTLLARCGVATDGAGIHAYAMRGAAASPAAVRDGARPVAVRLTLADGLSFVERVGFRYCADKALRASAAAACWRMAKRSEDPHGSAPALSSTAALLERMGAREWFAPLAEGAEEVRRRHCDSRAEVPTLPAFTLRLSDRRPAGPQAVFDLTVADIHAFVAGGVGVHNCIGNSGPLPDAVAAAVSDNDLVVAAVLSGNRNYEGRIHPQVRAAYLASPPLVVAYALAGSVDLDLTRDPLGTGKDGAPVYLRDVWPSNAEVRDAIARAVTPELFRKTYAEVFSGDPIWQGLPVPEGNLYAWEADSTYIQEPPFFAGLAPAPAPLADIAGARALAVLGDSVTTDHISPAGAIPKDGPAGRFLVEHGVEPRDFNSFGSRRGNHQVMMRGTFGNVRLRNELVGGKEGDWTLHLPDGVEMRIFEASEKYRAAGTPLVIIAGKEYGSGSSRDWAAKGTLLLGVKAVIAESYERIHRSNLVGMGVVPLQFEAGQSRTTLGLDGLETYAIEGLATLAPGKKLTVRARRGDGRETVFTAIARVDSAIEVDYLRHGGILQMVLRNLARS
ncbi:MAG: aconitate hydratase AcnA [Myxococcales bacterium]|jgi:aconitase A|nr:aconitate hydratase AcnA [Myxococcales bacterium]